MPDSLRHWLIFQDEIHGFVDSIGGTRVGCQIRQGISSPACSAASFAVFVFTKQQAASLIVLLICSSYASTGGALNSGLFEEWAGIRRHTNPQLLILTQYAD